ncbi:MAG: hypothetical protein HYX74_07695 [Acidobacteria bacterium]|nr:hypothetical protein [Acidobacteriota bacterium]
MRRKGTSRAGIAPLLLFLLATSPMLADTVYLRDGSSVDGTYLGGNSREIRFRVDGLVRTYPVADVEQIWFGAAVASGQSGTGAAPEAASPGRRTASEPGPKRHAEGRNEYVIPLGTALRVRTSELIDSDSARVGDIFSATLDEDLVVEGELLAGRGSPAKLRLAQAEEAGEFKGRTILTIDLIEMTVGNSAYTLHATPAEQRGEAQGRRAAATVGGGAALGAIVGAIAGGGKGAAVGAAVGAAGGAGVQVLTRGEKLKIPAETVLEFRLQRELFLRR